MGTVEGDRPDEPSLEELSREECLSLLATYPVGRIAVSRPDAGPLVVPVNFILDGEVVVFRSDLGSKIEAVRTGPVSFQLDQIDPFRHTGWSVLVEGIAYEATPSEVEHLALEPWGPGEKAHWVRLLPKTISGRRIKLPELRRDPRGYL